MSSENRVAIFVDAENVTQWIEQDGLESFLEELSSIGTVVVRKAYARWTNKNLSAHQGTLNRLGFELIHTFHPVSRKNSADIQIAVDAMEYASREDLQCVALATGDSDFSPLFRRLREMGKQVVGAGPRSALSESVKSSCSRFFYIDARSANEAQDEATRASAFDDAADVLEAALKTFDGPANCAALKILMLNIDSAFDEKNLGFKSFTDFIRAVEGIGLHQDDKTWSAFFEDGKDSTVVPTEAMVGGDVARGEIDPIQLYRRILRKKHWRSVPARVMTTCFDMMKSIDALLRSEIPETVVMRCDGQITTTDVKKVTELFTKSGLMRSPGPNEEGKMVWQVAPVSEEEMLRTVDRAMTVRLLAGLPETGMKVDKECLRTLLLAERSDEQMDELLAEARRLYRSPKVQES